MKKIAKRPLSLQKEYIRILRSADLSRPRGGFRDYFPTETDCGGCHYGE